MGKKIAVFFDSDNVSADYVDFVFDELSKLNKDGTNIIKRAFRDWSKPSNWSKDLLDKYAISPIQVFSCAKSKNATDIAIVIAIIDEINRGIIDGVAIVSSDSDFSALADRIRASGLEAIGFGRSESLPRLKNAYDLFVELPQKDKSTNENTIDKDKLPLDKDKIDILTKAFKEVGDKNGWCDIGKIGVYFKDNGIDSKIFGRSLKKFFEKYPKHFEVAEKSIKDSTKKRPFVKFIKK